MAAETARSEARVERRDLPVAGMPAILRLPEDPAGLVIFAHGSGSSRHSPRNNAVALALGGARLATLLTDLLTPDEADDRRLVFDIRLLAGRLLACMEDAAAADPRLRDLPLGLFGASTGAAAALVAAAGTGGSVRAVVSRGGRPDLAGGALARVTAPTLLIVGSRDREVLELNRGALAQMTGAHALEIVPGATHLFEEPGTLEAVTALAQHWFIRNLSPLGTTPAGQIQKGPPS